MSKENKSENDIIYENIKKKRGKSNTFKEIVFSLSFAFVLFMIAFYTASKPKEDDIKLDYCKMVCEGEEYKIKNDTCICDNGEKYIIEK